MNKEEMKERTNDFAKKTILLCRELPNNREGNLIGNQLFRAGTSVGANYRAVCRARSRADFISKLGIVEEEADESLFWMELLTEMEILKSKLLKDLYQEGKEILAIIVSSRKTAKRNIGRN